MAKYSELRRVLLIFMLAAGPIESTVKIPTPMLAIMNASRASLIRSVLLYSPSDTESFYVMAKELPIPIKFMPTSLKALSREFNTYFRYNVHKCYFTCQHCLEFIFLADSRFDQSRVMKREIRNILFQQPRRLLIVEADSHAKSLRYFDDNLCNVITVTSFYINFPEDYYRCESRKTGHAQAFLAEEKLSTVFPKHNIYKTSLRDGSKRDLLHSETLALLDAYKTLNNTMEEAGRRLFLDVMEKRVDISLPPFPAVTLHEHHVFACAHYAPYPICFFTAKQKASVAIFLDSWGSLLRFTGSITILFTILVLYVNIRCRLFFVGERRRRNSLIFMFFLTTLFGKSPSPAIVRSPTFRGFAIASWVFGMLVIGCYIQSSITAIRLVPMDVPVVRSYEDLLHFIRTGTLTPCYNSDWEGYLMSSVGVKDIQLRGQIAIAGRHNTLLLSHGGDFSECYRRTQARTHVALSLCSDEEREAASKWNLVAGDHFVTSIRAPAIHVTNPHRCQHRRLLLAIWEHGLATPHRRYTLPETPDKEKEKQSLNVLLLPFIIGCIISCVSLGFEIALQTKLRVLQHQAWARFTSAYCRATTSPF